MATLMTKALHRTHNTRGASFLTHGADDFDHKGANNARRMMDKATVEQFEEAEESHESMRSGETTFRVVIGTQCYENYGTHCCNCESDDSCTCESHWKPKGGSEYHHNVGGANNVIELGAKGIQAVVDMMTAKVARSDRFFSEYVVEWEIVPSTEETYEEKMYREIRDERWCNVTEEQAEEEYQRQMTNLVLICGP